MGILIGSISIGIVIIIVLVMFAIRAVSAKMLIKVKEELTEKYSSEHFRDKTSANFFGLRSDGAGQVRGNGVLLLSDRMLIFRLLIPARWYEVRIENIFKISHPWSFLGKSHLSKLLVIDFTDDQGQENAIGFLVKEPDEWAKKIIEASGREIPID